MPFLPIGDNNPRLLIARPYVVWALIAGCIGIHIWQQSLPPQAAHALAVQLGMIPKVLVGPAQLDPALAVVPAWLTPLTATVLHGGIGHLAMNMLFLGIFGDNIEDALGHARFVVFYALCALAAALTHAGTTAQPDQPMIGASGAIAGVLGAYLVLYPRARVTLLLGWIPLVLPAWLLLSMWIAFQLISAVGSEGAGVAWWAHVGGFAAGIGLVVVMCRPMAWLASRGRHPRGVTIKRRMK